MRAVSNIGAVGGVHGFDSIGFRCASPRRRLLIQMRSSVTRSTTQTQPQAPITHPRSPYSNEYHFDSRWRGRDPFDSTHSPTHTPQGRREEEARSHDHDRHGRPLSLLLFFLLLRGRRLPSRRRRRRSNDGPIPSPCPCLTHPSSDGRQQGDGAGQRALTTARADAVFGPARPAAARSGGLTVRCSNLFPQRGAGVGSVAPVGGFGV